MDDAAADPVLRRYRGALEALYGERLVRAILFGSRARGEARADSDYDVAVFLAGEFDRWAEADRLAELSVRFFDETGALVDAAPYSAGAERERSPLMGEIRREGQPL